MERGVLGSRMVLNGLFSALEEEVIEFLLSLVLPSHIDAAHF